MESDFNRLRVFVEVVERGGFAAAARGLGMPRSTVSRWMQELEQQLGVRLLQRTTRKVELTEIGVGYYERGVKAVDAARQASAWVHSQSERPHGTLVIATFQLFAETLLGPLLVTYLEDNPGMSAQVVLNERNIDLVGEHVDVAVRIGSMADSSLVVRKLADLEGCLVASPDYLAKHGSPAHPRELVDHSTVVYGHGQDAVTVRFDDGDQHLDVSLSSRCTTNSIELVRQVTLGGLGIGAVPPILVHEDLVAGRLVRVLPEWSNDGTQPIFVAYPSRIHLPRKVRAFVDLLTAEVTSAAVNGLRPL
ncbi:MAG: LysR family transcriptional regulator [Deltaproteobacteria bacterium]|nr:LysR family transcriptional regulator [Deltaproteobacteria bacterium]